MNDLAVIIFWVLVALIVGQAAMVARFVRALHRAGRTRGQPEFRPKAAVVLCLRGADPFLGRCLAAVFRLDYPAYDVKIVVDRREDPAWEVVERVAGQCPAAHVDIQPLTNRRETCSLKCSSLLQAIGSLDESYEVVALLDADTIPHPGWLRELVAPLADPQVGVATGNRWYMPDEVSWATLVRSIWNAAAVVQMYWYGIPWGGTLAIKTRVLRQCNLAERWGQALCEDTMLYQAMRAAGLRVAFAAPLMMINRERGDMSGFFTWVSRQLLAARLYHSRWPLVLAHGIGTSLAMAAAAAVAIWGLAAGAREAAAWTASGLALYLAAMPLLVLPVELCVRRIARARGEPARWLTPWNAARVWPAIVLTQIVYVAALVRAIFVRTVRWRGVVYRVDGPWNIRVTDDQPFEAPCAEADTLASL
ncbi:MAG: glycosyltransferase family 2 protein [Thermoguttaceae bacterium]